MTTSVYVRWIWIVVTSALVVGLSALVVGLSHAVMVTSSALDRAEWEVERRCAPVVEAAVPLSRERATDSGWSMGEERLMRAQVEDAIRVRANR